jgi:GT2 family glycosyltransferase
MTINNETEIIIVNDNPSTPLNTNDFEEFHKPLKIITPEKNGGYSCACNIGAAEAEGDNLIFMDCDIMPVNGWFESMIHALHETNNCGAVSATILNMETGGVVHWGMGMVHGVDVLKPFRDCPLPEKLNKGIYEFNLLTSGCLLVPKDVFNQTKGFDSILYNGYCDLDLIMKIKTIGYKCVTSSEAVVYHRGKVAGQTRIASEEDTRALFVYRWGEKLPDDGLQLLQKLFLSHNDYPGNGHVLLINFSRSLLALEYHDVLKKTFSLNIECKYDFRNVFNTRIILEDYLSWSLTAIDRPIIYFCDNIMQLKENRHWFSYREGRKDYLIDRHGNVMLTDKIIKYFNL